MSVKMFIKVLTILTMSVGWSSCWNLTLLHVNDIHMRVEETNKYSSPCKEADKAKGKCYGGMARLLTAVSQIRDNRENALWLNAGDLFQGTLWYTLFKWQVAARFNNILKFDAMTLGNHEFDDGIEGLIPFLQNQSCPVVVSNLNDSIVPEIHGLYTKSHVVDVNGRRVGIVGYITPQTKDLAFTGNLQLTDEIEAVKKEAERLHNDGVDIIVGLGHSGYDKDIEIAEKVPYLDVIVGGHSHTFLYSPTPEKENPSNNRIGGPYPSMITGPGGNNVLVVQAFAYTKYLGHLELQFDDNGGLVGFSGDPILLDSSFQQDKMVLAEIEPLKGKLVQFSKTIVGVADHYLSQSRSGESILGNLVTDAMVWAHREKLANGTKPSLAVINSGGLRVGLEKGNITLEDLLTLIPFEDTYDLVSIKGRHLRLAFEHSVAGFSSSGENRQRGRFLQVSGFHLQFNFLRDEGSRLVKVRVRSDNGTDGYVDMEDEEVYRVVMNKYITEGGDGYDMIEDNKIGQLQGPLDTDAVRGFMMKNTPINAPLEGRIVIVSTKDLELSYETVARLAKLPLDCIKKEYPNHLGQHVLGDPSDLKTPSELHPIFYGCFDWHSAVHGHWLLSQALHLTPLATNTTSLSNNITLLLNAQLTAIGVAKELAYFTGKHGKTFERTYGWAWLLKLQQELVRAEGEEGWAETLAPLAEEIRNRYLEFLPRLVYPVRVGTHSNTAFGLSLALDYARTEGVEDAQLEEAIVNTANKFFLEDKNCPLGWEPSGFDFLSPCLQEADLMARVIPAKADLTRWLQDFLPQLFSPNLQLEEGRVLDRADGHLVHLDGLNFSRAWALYRLGQRLGGEVGSRLIGLGDRHVTASLLEVVDSQYEGSHWLATFLLYALQARQEALDAMQSMDGGGDISKEL